MSGVIPTPPNSEFQADEDVLFESSHLSSFLVDDFKNLVDYYNNVVDYNN